MNKVLLFIAPIKYFLGSLCILFAYIFSSSEGGYSDALQQMLALALLSMASLFFGLSVLSPIVTTVFVGGIFLIMLTPNPYLGRSLTGISGLVLASLACQTGAYLRRKPDVLLWLLFAVAAAAFINAVEGLLQWFGLVGELYRWVPEPEQRGIAYGALRQPNLFATLLCVGSVCTVWLFHRRLLSLFMSWTMVSVLMFAVAASGSRTGLLEVLALAVLALLWRKQYRFAVTGLMAGQSLVLALAMLILPIAARWHGFGFTSGLVRVAKTGQDARLEIWSDTLHMIAQHPWFGWGWREMGYGHYVTLFNHRFDGLLEHSHNLFLQIAVEFGLPVAVLFFGGLLWLIFHAEPWKFGSNPRNSLLEPELDRQFAWAILLLIVGIHSMLEYPLWYAGFLFLTGVFVGYLLPVIESTMASKKYGIWSKRMGALSAALMVCLASVGWQQYAKVLLIYKTPFTANQQERHNAILAAINGASDAWMFREYLDFTRIGLSTVTPENASDVRQRAEELLHFSAEPKVIEPLLESLWYLNDTNAWLFHAGRFCRAFPAEFQRWRQTNANLPLSHIAEKLPEAC